MLSKLTSMKKKTIKIIFLVKKSLKKTKCCKKNQNIFFKKEISSAMMADGTEIPEHVVKRCEEIIEEESIQFKWEKGDVVFFDNYALLHGRRPSLPPRKVLVATCK